MKASKPVAAVSIQISDQNLKIEEVKKSLPALLLSSNLKKSEELICIDEGEENLSFDYEIYKATNISNLIHTCQKESLISILLDFNESAVKHSNSGRLNEALDELLRAENHITGLGKHIVS